MGRAVGPREKSIRKRRYPATQPYFLLESDGTCRLSRHPDYMGIGIIRANALAEPADGNTSDIETRDLIRQGRMAESATCTTKSGSRWKRLLCLSAGGFRFPELRRLLPSAGSTLSKKTLPTLEQ